MAWLGRDGNKMVGAWAVPFPFDNIKTGGYEERKLRASGRGDTALFSNLEIDALAVIGKS